ncbi:MAG: hypothetical protein ABI811_01565 [Acidobacteriota bacterium]
MTQPDELKKNEPPLWSAGLGTDVWAMPQAAMTGDLARLRKLADDPKWATPLAWAEQRGHTAIAELLR